MIFQIHTFQIRPLTKFPSKTAYYFFLWQIKVVERSKERKVFEEIVRKLDKRENDSLPQVKLGKHEVWRTKFTFLCLKIQICLTVSWQAFVHFIIFLRLIFSYSVVVSIYRRSIYGRASRYSTNCKYWTGLYYYCDNLNSGTFWCNASFST